MKKEFIGFYDPTKEEVDAAWTDGIFAFDANSLLNLYRYTEVTRKDFLGALKAIEKRLFIPYQAAYEFHSNRYGVIEGLKKSYDDLFKIFETNFQKDLLNQINRFKRHPSIEVEKITKIQESFLAKINGELEKQKKSHPNFNSDDDVLQQVSALFENKVGKKNSSEELKKIYKDGELRYADRVPPGYEDVTDKKKKGDQHAYGDLIIWFELIGYTKNSKKPLIFVTDDRKEDWWRIENGKTIRPREELIKEFFDLTGVRILIYNADLFLKYAKERKLVPKLKEETITEVKQIRMGDEKANSIISRLEEQYYKYKKPASYYLSSDLDSGDKFYGYQLTTKYSDIWNSKTIQNLPKTYLTIDDYLKSGHEHLLYDPKILTTEDLSSLGNLGELTDSKEVGTVITETEKTPKVGSADNTTDNVRNS